MSFIAGKVYVLETEKDYTPGYVNNGEDAFQGVIPLNQSAIMSIHIIGQINNSVTITTHTGSTVIFPVGSLQVGAIYPYSVKRIARKVEDSGKILGLAPGYKSVMF